MVHATNIVNELNELESVLVDAKTLLILRAKQDEQTDISRVHAASVQRGKSQRGDR